MADIDTVLEQNPTRLNFFLEGLCLGQIGAVRLQKHLQCTPSVSVIELRGSTLGHQGAMHLASALRGHPGLTHLGIARNGLDSSAAVAIIEALDRAPLRTLDLEWNSLDNTVAAALARKLVAEGCELLAVSLERNDIRWEGGEYLATALETNKSLRNLDLAFNRCANRGASAFGRALKKNNTLLTLNLNGNDIALEGGRGIVDGLMVNKTLHSLNLQGNQLFAAFAEHSTNLAFAADFKELNLYNNRVATMQSAEGFGTCLQQARSMMALSLGKCGAGDSMITPILTGISFMVSLVTLDLSHAGMSPQPAQYLRDVLNNCTNLATLILDGNRLETSGAAEIAPGFVHASALTYLSLNDCALKAEGVRAIMASFAKRRGLPLAELYLAGNALDADAPFAIREALAAEGGLRSLDLAQNNMSVRAVQALWKIFGDHKMLQCVGLRDNHVADVMNASFANRENLAAFIEAAGFGKPGMSDEAVAASVKAAAAANAELKDAAMTVVAGTPKRSELPRGPLVTNFNSSTADALPEAQYTTTAEQRARAMQASRRELAVLEDSTTGDIVEASKAATKASPTRQRLQRSADDEVCVPGLAAMTVTPFSKRRVQLHDVESNIGEMCITETQLRLKFAEWDRDGNGYLTAEEFRRSYAQQIVVRLPSDEKKEADLLRKFAKDGKIFFDEFCVMMLALVGK